MLSVSTIRITFTGSEKIAGKATAVDIDQLECVWIRQNCLKKSVVKKTKTVMISSFQTG